MSDAAYGTYCRLLFEPVHEQLWHAGYRPRPRLPGNFSLSREWGSEPQRQRWFWSVIGSPGGGALGTIVIVFHHDHTQISIVRPPEVLPLEEITNESVIRALSRRSVDFSNALEARIEIADGMRPCALEQA